MWESGVTGGRTLPERLGMNGNVIRLQSQERFEQAGMDGKCTKAAALTVTDLKHSEGRKILRFKNISCCLM